MTSGKSVFICPTCGHKTAEYRHGLTRMLVECLWHLHQAGGRSRLDKMGLGNTQFTNFQKLRYFGLAMPTAQNREWILTAAGEEFLQGRRRMPQAVFTRDAVVRRKADEQVFIHEIKDCAQYKTEWQEQARQPGLFD